MHMTYCTITSVTRIESSYATKFSGVARLPKIVLEFFSLNFGLSFSAMLKIVLEVWLRK